MEVVDSLSQGRTAAGQCGLFIHKSVPVIFETPLIKFHVTSSTSALPQFIFKFHVTSGTSALPQFIFKFRRSDSTFDYLKTAP